MIVEWWVQLEGYGNLYQISSLGRVRRIDSGKILKNLLNPNGYLHVVLSCYGITKTVDVHRLVAETFILNIDSKREVNHIDGIKTHNDVDNLEWVHSWENTRHKTNVLKKNIKGETNVNAKLNNSKVKRIKMLLKSGKYTQREIARMFGVHFATISLIKLNKLWVHVT